MSTSSKSYKVVIVDDHEIFTEGFETLLKKIDFLHFMGAYNSPDHFIKDLPNAKPDIVFMDMEMPFMDGCETTKRALQIEPGLKIITLTSCNDGYSVKRMLEAGSCAYMTKDLNSAKIYDVFEYMKTGKTYISPEVILNQAFQTGEMDLNFTRQDISIIQLLARNKTAIEIAQDLEISEKTVELEKAKLYKKLGVNSTIELVVMAYKLKIIK